MGLLNQNTTIRATGIRLLAGVIVLSGFISRANGISLRTAAIFADHMVLQRDMEVPVWGWAGPGEVIRLSFNGQEKRTRCDRTGRWEIRLEPMRAGGPFRMVIAGKHTLVLEDILVGDVWICSGQSNMWRPVSDVVHAEKEIASAQYPQIRLFSVPRTFSARPVPDILPPHPDEARYTNLEWEKCAPERIRDFTAVGYFFGKEIHEHLSVPVGLIKCCWGNTKVEPWTSLEALEASPRYKAIRQELVDPVKILDSVTQAYTSRIDDFPGNDPGMSGDDSIWADPAFDDEDWNRMSVPTSWEDGGLGDLDGIVWFRREVYLPEEVIAEPFILRLDRVKDANRVWINNRFIGKNQGKIPGSPFYGSQPVSEYAVDPGILRAGRNVISVRVTNYSGEGGISGDACGICLESESTTILLAGEWKYKVALNCTIPPPKRVRPHQNPTVLFNGMIHPLIPLAIKGVIWYQGESNTGNPVPYRELFPGMIRDWRARWGQGDFPFLFVQLANFGEPDAEPGIDNWAMLREAQAMALSEPNTGMAVAIDIGETGNIHPKNKQDVGYRLALAARKVAYGEELVYSGPVFKSMQVDGSRVRIEFTHTGSGLVLDDRYGYARGFAIAGPDREWHWAKGYLDGDKVLIHSPGVEDPVAVRYAWSQNPGDANVYNLEGLPAVPFRTDNWE